MKILHFNINQGLYIFVFLFCMAVNAAAPLNAQLRFSAVCPEKKIGKSEYLQLQYIIENASHVEQILPPAFKNFSIVSGPSQHSGMTNINGKIRQYMALEFILKPNKPGTFILPPATAKADGKNLLSNSLSIEVSHSPTAGSSAGTSFSPFGQMMDVLPAPVAHQYDDYILHKGENLAEKIKKNLFVNVKVSRTACYVGEPVVASFKLYTRLKSESNLTKSPSFNGFSVTEMEMPENYQVSTEKYNKRDYNVYTLRKVQLYPLQPGTIELEPIEVENRVTFIKADYADANKADLFYDLMRDFADASAPANAIEEQKITLQSQPVNITVKPLPVQGQPNDFKGAVGSFAMNAEISEKSMNVDEAGNLIITISGSGNIQMVNAPDVQWPDGMESFEPKSSEVIDKFSAPVKGQKTFNYAFTVSKPGTYLIPVIRFSYFDVAARNYKTISTSPFRVSIKHGNPVKHVFAKTLKNASKNKEGKFAGSIYSSYMILVAALLTITGLLLWKAKKGRIGSTAKPVLPAVENNAPVTTSSASLYNTAITKNPLQEAGEMLLANDAADFYHAVNDCIRSYLSVKLNFPEKELGKKKINELLDKASVDVSTTLMLTSLMEDIELHLYAPFSTADKIRQVYERAVEVVALLDKQLNPMEA